jgi:prolyl oligopeptidase
MALTLNPLPATPSEPVTETLHGVAVTDPYRWLEDQNSPQTRKWLQEQTAYARAYLDAIPRRDVIRKRVEELLAVEVISQPLKVGNRYFFLKRVARGERPVITMREGDTGPDICLVDPSNRWENNSVVVGIVNTSRDGKILAYSVRCGGEDSYAVEFLDVDRSVLLMDRLPRGVCRGLSFSPTGDGFHYVHREHGMTDRRAQTVRWHAFGTEIEADSEVFSIDQDIRRVLMLLGSSYGSFMCYFVVSMTDPPTAELYFHDLSSGKQPKKIVKEMNDLFVPQLVDRRILVLTQWKAPNGRIVSIDPFATETDAWEEIVPETGARIQTFTVAGGVIFALLIENAVARIDSFDLSSKACSTVPCPPHGTPRISSASPDTDTLFYEFSSFSHAPTIYRYNAISKENLVWAQSHVVFDPASVATERLECASRDGTRIPLLLITHKGSRLSKPLPVFLTGYGGFGSSVTPQFSAFATYLIEQGFAFVLANLRGGSEFGEQWHSAGKRHNRQNAIDDFIAVAEWLLTAKIAAPGRLAIGGGSNAGLLVGAALTQRPDLFGAAICLGPLLDMLRYHKFDEANLWVDEYGCAENETDFKQLAAYSPYHHVKDGVSYPGVMLISGDADTRCNPMHARKMTARLQAATASGRPIVLAYNPNWGHTPVQPLTVRIEALTDRLAFLCHELSVQTPSRRFF